MSTDITIDQPTVRQVDQERIRNAQKKRNAQLKAWAQYDRKMELENSKRRNKGINTYEPCFITFPQDIVLMEAAFRGDLEELRRLLEEGICPDAVNADGLTVLHQSSIDNNIEMCKLLLSYGADINAKDQELWTPLHVAAACPHPELCKFLIDNGADLLALNADGNMPYDICEDEKALTIIESKMAAKNIQQSDIDERRKVPERMMIYEVEQAYKEGKDLDKLDSQGAAYIHIAASCGYADVVSNLMDHGANIDVLDKDGWKAIHIAAYWSHLEVITVLCHYGADIDGKTTNGETVFSLCQDDELLQRLIELKRDIERMKINNQLLNTTKGSEKSKGLIRRRSSNNPRGSSIRRTSMREKKALSWKEAREEGNIFQEKGLPVHPKELTNPSLLVDVNGFSKANSLDRPENTLSNGNRYSGINDSNPHSNNSNHISVTSNDQNNPTSTNVNKPAKKLISQPQVNNNSSNYHEPPALPPGGHRSNYAASSPQIRTSIDGLIPKKDPNPSNPRNPVISAYRDDRNPSTNRKDPNFDDSQEFVYRPPNKITSNSSSMNPSHPGPRPVYGGSDSLRSPIPSQYNAYNMNGSMNFPRQPPPPGKVVDYATPKPLNSNMKNRSGSGRIPYGYEDNIDEKRRIAQSGKCCIIM